MGIRAHFHERIEWAGLAGVDQVDIESISRILETIYAGFMKPPAAFTQSTIDTSRTRTFTDHTTFETGFYCLNRTQNRTAINKRPDEGTKHCLAFCLFFGSNKYLNQKESLRSRLSVGSDVTNDSKSVLAQQMCSFVVTETPRPQPEGHAHYCSARPRDMHKR